MKFLSAKKTIGGCQQSGFLKNLNFSLFCPRLPKIWGRGRCTKFFILSVFLFLFLWACVRACDPEVGSGALNLPFRDLVYVESDNISCRID